MKVAILLVGEYRTFPYCRKTMLFLDQQDLDADVYFSTWNETNTINPVSNANKEFENYSPIYVPVTEEQIRKDIGIPITCAVHEKKKYSGFPIIIDGWFLGFDLIKKSGKAYDYVLMLRPDLFFDNDFRYRKLSLLLQDTFESYKEGLGIRMPPKIPKNEVNNIDHYLLDDNMFFSSFENMENLISEDFKIFFKEHEKICGWHQLLFRYIVIKKNIKLLPLPFLANNAIARYPIDNDTPFAFVEKQWWEWWKENN